MSSTVYQGLQSCLEPPLVEPQALGLKLVAPMSNFLGPIRWVQISESNSDTSSKTNNKNIINDNNGDTKSDDNDNNNNKIINSNGDFSSWSFIQALPNTSPSLLKEENEEKEAPYVYPLIKQSSPRLNQESLDLCTENLGCETGTNISENIHVSSFSTRSKLRQNSSYTKLSNGSYPPPLTSISGSNCIRIRPHREGGRLVMKVVVIPSFHTNFQAERIDGYLSLRFLNNYKFSSFDSKAVEEGKEEQQEQVQDHVHEARQEEVDEDHLEEEIDGTNGIDGGEMGMEEFQGASRCKEAGQGNKGNLIWGHFCVATS